MSAAALVISDAAKLPNASLQAAIAAANAAEAILRGRFFFSKSKKRYAYKKTKKKIQKITASHMAFRAGHACEFTPR